jgi:RNA recognition motif-containing protein
MTTKLFIGNLEYSTTEGQLREMFAAHGSVLSAAIVVDGETGRSRGFGFVEYDSHGEAERAIGALDGTDVHGRQLKVNIARPRGDTRGGQDHGARGGFVPGQRKRR